MRVLQLIDSLEPGGAERIAVTFANSLAGEVSYTALCATRKEGILKSKLDPDVEYLFLAKKSTYDLASFRRLQKFIRQNRIGIIHAHSSSFFFATLVRIFQPKIKLFWHDHYGDSENLSKRKAVILKFCSRFFDGIISVNEMLKNWALSYLHCKNVSYLSNFVPVSGFKESRIKIEGDISYRVVCLANFRPQKNHLNLLKAFAIVRSTHPEASLHLIGKTIDQNYSNNLRKYIAENSLENVTFHGAQLEVISLLSRCSVGVLSSDSEGLPVALLEYGVAGIAVVTTDVGECVRVVNGFGKIVQTREHEKLAEAILIYLGNEELRCTDAAAFKRHIISNYSVQAVLPKLIVLYKG